LPNQVVVSSTTIKPKNGKARASDLSASLFLRLKYIRTTAFGDEYAVSVLPEGKNDPRSCASHRTQFALFAEPGLLACRTEFYAYRFNLKSGRFAEGYMMGYVNDYNTNDDTPVISGGPCTK
jgi:hypothetical protein